jgi:hypothetical protein
MIQVKQGVNNSSKAGVQVTATIKNRKDLDGIEGKAFVFFQPVLLSTDDALWEKVIAYAVNISGGVEVVVDDDCLQELRNEMASEGCDIEDPDVPVKINDPYYPPLRVLAPLSYLKTKANLVEKGGGPRAGKQRVRCSHSEDAHPIYGCDYCFWTWWTKEAKEKGIPLK